MQYDFADGIVLADEDFELPILLLNTYDELARELTSPTQSVG